jgi:hypothetical protein
MIPRSDFFEFFGQTQSSLFLVAILAVSFPYNANAQAPAVPRAFQHTYTELDNYLVNFNTTLGSTKGSTSNIDDRIAQSMGAQAIMVQIGFPVLNDSFLTGQGQSYTAFLSYRQGVAQSVKAAGMKLIVEDDTLIADSVSGNWPGAGCPGLSWRRRADSSTEIGLTWSASTGGLPAAHYMVYRGASSTKLSQVAITTNTSYTDRSVSPAWPSPILPADALSSASKPACSQD